MKMVAARALFKKTVLSTAAFVLALSSVTAAVPFILSSNASAAGPSAVVYDSLPSVVPQTSYQSRGFQATSTAQLGDLVHLGGSNRILDDVTVGLVNWAMYSEYSSNPTYSGNSTSWSQPITLNVYSNNGGQPGTVLATSTQSFNIPWRPAGDPTCAEVRTGVYGWREAGVCRNYNGFANNVTFDLSSLNVTLPEDVIVAVGFNTQTYGASPTGVAGPYNSLNVSIPASQPVSVGSDDSSSTFILNSTYQGRPAGLSSASGQGVNGTVALQITATGADTTRPTVSFVNPSTDGQAFRGNLNVQFQANDNDLLKSVTVNIKDQFNNAHLGSCGTTNAINAAAYTLNCTIDTTDFADGTYYLRGGATDVSNNNKTISQKVVFDNSKPTNSITYPIANSTQASDFTITGVATDATSGVDYVRVLVTKYNANGSFGGYIVDEDVTVDASGNYQLSVTLPHNEGPHGYRVHTVAFDKAGNNQSREQRPVYVDIEAPSVELISPTNGAVVKGASLTQSWTTTSTDIVKYIYTSYNDEAKTSVRWNEEFSGTTTSKTATNVGDATFWWEVTAVDATGNETTSPLWKLVVDNTAPAVSINSPVASSFNSDVEVRGTATDANLRHYWVKVTRNGSTVHEQTVTSTGITNELLYTATLTGDYVVTFAARDTAGGGASTGNRSADVVKSFSIDQTVPTADILFPAIGEDADGFEVQFSEAVNPVDATNPANYFLNNWVGAGGSGDLAGDAFVTYNPTTYKATVAFLSSAWYVSPEQQWGVENVRDLAGNPIATVTEYSTPNEAPGNPGIPSTTNPTASLTSTWSWDAAVDANGPNGSGVKEYEYSFVTDGDSAGSWTKTTSTSATTTASADGTYRLFVRAIDNAGNVGGIESNTVVIDTNGPDVEVLGATYLTRTPELTGTVGSDAQKVEVSILDATNVQVESGPATFTPGNTTWTYLLNTSLPNGNYTVVATAFDSLDNTKVANAEMFVAVPAPAAPAQNNNDNNDEDDENTDEDDVVTLVVPTIVGPAAALGVDTDNSDDNTDGENGEVEGVSTLNNPAQAADSEANQGTWMGLAWYWWLLIIAGLTALAWWIIAAIRGRQAES